MPTQVALTSLLPSAPAGWQEVYIMIKYQRLLKMNRRETVEFVNMCMIQNGDKVLVQDRVSPDWPGITFPGGHVERGESFVDAVIREVKEETGLTISKPQLCGIKDWYDDAVFSLCRPFL